MARAVAGEAEVAFFNISASQCVEMFVGLAPAGSGTCSKMPRRMPRALFLSTNWMPSEELGEPGWEAATMSGNRP